LPLTGGTSSLSWNIISSAIDSASAHVTLPRWASLGCPAHAPAILSASRASSSTTGSRASASRPEVKLCLTTVGLLSSIPSRTLRHTR